MSGQVSLTAPVDPSIADPTIADYDSNDYDYRTFWAGRDYEQWAEQVALRAAVDRMHATLAGATDPGRWVADLGGGFGRNLAHAWRLGECAVLVDYSVNNLRTAADQHAEAVADGRLHLVRADLARLPFRTGAFDAALCVRVLHHLVDLDAALPEMLRTVSRSVLIDVPIKHHLLARMRAVRAGRSAEMRTPDPQVVGTSEHPFREYHLPTVHAAIGAAGFGCESIASVNNLRRWDQRLPRAAVWVCTPPAKLVERALQPAGIGWWGPNQFVLATRGEVSAADPTTFAARCCCPRCGGDLHWSADAAQCFSCAATYPRSGAFWDFAA